VRRLLLIGLGSCVVMRLWSGLYFIPEMLAFQRDPSGRPSNSRVVRAGLAMDILDLVPRAARLARPIISSPVMSYLGTYENDRAKFLGTHAVMAAGLQTGGRECRAVVQKRVRCYTNRQGRCHSAIRHNRNELGAVPGSKAAL